MASSRAGAQERGRLIAEEQAALRRVATLVASGGSSGDVFSAVAGEVARVLDVAAVMLARYEHDRVITVLASVSEPSFQVGGRWPLDGPSVSAEVLRTGRPARIDDFSELPGAIAAGVRESNLRGGVGAPIVVDGKLWGVITVGTRDFNPMPSFAEARLSEFSELAGMAISNAESRERLEQLAAQQAALRGVALLVARGASTSELGDAVLREVVRVLGVPAGWLIRYESERSMSVVAALNDSDAFPSGSRWPLEGSSLSATLRETGRPARIDDYSRLEGAIAARMRESGFVSAVGAPITVEGSIWGAVCIGTREHTAVPLDIDPRLSQFTELVAISIANAESRDRLHALAEEQAALRRVATLVAEGIDSPSLFDAVCAETGRLLGAASVNLSHYTADGFNVTMAGWSLRDTHVQPGARFPITPDTLGGAIVKTHAPVRIDSWANATSDLAKLVKERGIRSSLAAPIVVDGHLWGALVAATDKEEPLPPRTEFRLARFTELIATAISNAANRSDLIASRARIVAAGDEARRRIERNLHDGTQQRLIALGLDLQRVRGGVTRDQTDVHEGLERLEGELAVILEEVRELSRGLHPPSLSRVGLGPALRALTRRSPIPIETHIDLSERPPAEIETALYYVVSEALTNVLRHACASTVTVNITAAVGAQAVRATIADDGVGGAAPSEGSGLVGLRDRVEALGGHFELDSPVAGGTRLSLDLPVRALPVG